MHDNALTRRLEVFGALAADDHELIDRAVGRRFALPARHVIAGEGEPAVEIFVILSGIACRARLVSDVSRQITSFMLPGDTCDTRGLMIGRRDVTIETISACRVGRISGVDLAEMSARPAIARALTLAGVETFRILREWLVSIGRRDPLERVAHLLCELRLRMSALGLEQGGGFPFPISQFDIADAMGLSVVEAARAVQALGERGLVVLRSGTARILNWDGLVQAAGFFDDYLRIDAKPGPQPAGL